MREMERRGVDYRLCILGQEFRNSPQAFQTIKHEFDHRLAHCGFEPSREKYQAWLSSADIMLSTSIHEFQGLAVLEAVALGCIPVLPKRMSYPELVPLQYLYESREEDIEREAKAAADLLEHHAQLLIEGRAEVPSVKRFFWSELKGSYEQVMIELVEGHSNNRPATIEW
jgi:glycosyltransferase involved in cell wall biosynthesis